MKKAAGPSSAEEADENNRLDTTAYAQDHDEHFVGENGNKIGGTLRFRIKDLDTSSSSDKEKAFVSIEGTLLSDEEEAELDEIEALKVSKKDGGKGNAAYVMSGAQPITVDEVQAVVSESRPKHRIKYRSRFSRRQNLRYHDYLKMNNNTEYKSISIG